MNVTLPSCFLTVSVGKIDEIQFESLQYTFHPSFDIKFIKKAKMQSSFIESIKRISLKKIFYLVTICFFF
jgi:hypothetical protein